MRLFGSADWPQQRRSAALVLASYVAVGILYVWKRDQIRGSTLPGFLAGLTASTIIVYDASFALRRWERLRNWIARRLHVSRTERLVPCRPAHDRLRRHIWLGLLSVPLVYLHCGPYWGGTLSSALFVGFALVIASGVYGLLLQQFLPRLMRLEVPDETIYAQIPELIEQLRWEAELLVQATCGAIELLPVTAGAASEPAGPDPMVLAARAHRVGRGAGLLDHVPRAPIPRTEALRSFYRDRIAPFLGGEPSGSALRRVVREVLRGAPAEVPAVALWSPTRANSLFGELRSGLDPACHDVVDALKAACDRHRQLADQARLHARLHAWIPVHLCGTTLLIVLLVLHAWYAWRY